MNIKLLQKFIPTSRRKVFQLGAFAAFSKLISSCDSSVKRAGRLDRSLATLSGSATDSNDLSGVSGSGKGARDDWSRASASPRIDSSLAPSWGSLSGSDGSASGDDAGSVDGSSDGSSSGSSKDGASGGSDSSKDKDKDKPKPGEPGSPGYGGADGATKDIFCEGFGYEILADPTLVEAAAPDSLDLVHAFYSQETSMEDALNNPGTFCIATKKGKPFKEGDHIYILDSTGLTIASTAVLPQHTKEINTLIFDNYYPESNKLTVVREYLLDGKIKSQKQEINIESSFTNRFNGKPVGTAKTVPTNYYLRHPYMDLGQSNSTKGLFQERLGSRKLSAAKVGASWSKLNLEFSKSQTYVCTDPVGRVITKGSGTIINLLSPEAEYTKLDGYEAGRLLHYQNFFNVYVLDADRYIRYQYFIG